MNFSVQIIIVKIQIYKKYIQKHSLLMLLKYVSYVLNMFICIYIICIVYI